MNQGRRRRWNKKRMWVLLFFTDKSLDTTVSCSNAQRNGNHGSRKPCSVNQEITLHYNSLEHEPWVSEWVSESPVGGGGLLPYVSYLGMYGAKGSYPGPIVVWNRVWLVRLLNLGVLDMTGIWVCCWDKTNFLPLKSGIWSPSQIVTQMKAISS